MSKFSEISKAIGWESKSLTYPTLTVAMALRDEVFAGSESAFVSVFKMNRFLPIAANSAQAEVSLVINGAFEHGRKLLEEKENSESGGGVI